MPTEIEIYGNYMADVRARIDLVRGLLTIGVTQAMPEFALAEVIFLQLRKVLELIAFASLAANKDAYATAYPTFAEDWKAKRILEKIGELNPDFYPMALDEPQEIAPGRKHFDRPATGFLTKDEFVTLYQAASEVLHTRNPYTAKSLTNPNWLHRGRMGFAHSAASDVAPRGAYQR